MKDSSGIRCIGVNTGGGDAPGLNAVIRAVVKCARARNWEVIGIRKGYTGLLDTAQTLVLDEESVRGITHQGGTILGTMNRGHPFEFPVRDETGATRVVDRSDEVVANFRNLGLDALVAIGGDGSLRIARRFHEKGIPVVGVPKTIDNDVDGTDVTFGFDTAVATAADALDKLHTTAESHERVMVVEVMGRYVGWIALHAGLSATADAILIPEIPFRIESVCEKVRERDRVGRRFTIVVVAEGARPEGGDLVTLGPAEVGREVRLGGIAEQVARAIHERTGKETRSLILGHLQRGGGPTSFDRLLSLRFGSAAVDAVAEGRFGTVVALRGSRVEPIPIADAIGRMKTVPLDGDLIRTARALGISLGE